jgi:hypothetical protein
MVLWRVSSRVATVAILGLVALDVALVMTALQSTHASGIDTRPVSSATPSTVPASPSATASPTTSPATSPSAANAPLQTLLVALDNQKAWRVHAGSCSAGGASLATTADGGKTWAKRDANLRQIVRVRPDDIRAAFVIGAGTSCAPELKNTSDGGATWSSGGSGSLAWFRDPKDPQLVRAPGAAKFQPCGKQAILDLAAITAGSARVLCEDGMVRSTKENGTVWTDVGKVDGAVALAVATASPAETYVAQVGVQDCAGVQIVRVRQRAVSSCVLATLPDVPGQIAISLIKGGGWLSVGGITLRSTDDLVTWKAP